MRFLLVVLFWLVFVGGLKAYTWQRDMAASRTVAAPVQVERLSGNWILELTPTFSAEADPFALETEDGAPAPIEVSLNAVPVALDSLRVVRGDALQIENLGELQQGPNEVFVKASPPLHESDLNHGIRVRILDGQAVLADETIWGNRGALVSGSVTFKLKSEEVPAHGHP